MPKSLEIVQLVPAYSDVSQEKRKLIVKITKESLAKFESAKASIDIALILMKRDIEDIYKAQQIIKASGKGSKKTTEVPNAENGK